MKKIELSENELIYLCEILNSEILDYAEDLHHDVNGKPYYYMPDGTLSYDNCELGNLPIAKGILKKL
ncbi:hypothetical protein [Companilactobacillus nantensis]|nr:hypothetical protein [Companilactobacillus nantensis]GEO64662.1 hypothetical protein LNA01_18450 [Companilactobacillus nantensis]